LLPTGNIQNVCVTHVILSRMRFGFVAEATVVSPLHWR
jgi:hypothetical protein